MAKKPKPKAKPATPPAKRFSLRALATGWKAVAGVLVFAAIVAVVIVVGDFAGDRVKGESRYEVEVARLQFNKPRYVDPEKFLKEVRYLGNLPEKVNIHDTNVHATLKTAIGKHPWAAREPEVTVTPEGKLSIVIEYRKPVMAVQIEGMDDWRVVDSLGVLLPGEAPLDDLPWLTNRVKAKEQVEGKTLGDPLVPAAIDVIKQFPAASVERTPNTWRITQAGGSVRIIPLGKE